MPRKPLDASPLNDRRPTEAGLFFFLPEALNRESGNCGRNEPEALDRESGNDKNPS